MSPAGSPTTDPSRIASAAWTGGAVSANTIVVVGSASYIAVPAALRLSLPDANPSLYVPMSLAVTFPFNVVLGIPLYWWAIGFTHAVGS